VGSAFIFDMDGTLVDNMAYHTQAWLALLAELGVHMTAGEARRRIAGQTNEQTLRQILGDEVSGAEIARYAARKESLYRALYGPHLKAVAGLDGFLAKAHCLGVPLAVATAADRANIAFVLGGLGIDHCFRVVVGAEDVAHGKPDPEMFLTAASRLGVPARQCLVFEDSLAGMEAARRAGMKAVALTTTLDAGAFRGLPGVLCAVEDFFGLDPEDLHNPWDLRRVRG
jgi:beta-phosphoglucomutase family hydrolase